MAERYADVIVAHTASAQFHSRAIVQFLSIGIPSARPRAHAGASVGRPDAAGPLRVVHSPSDPVSKGRDVIRGIVARLPEAGIDVEFVEISGRTHDDVMRALAGADLLLNEVYGDTPMGVLATEAAAVGVPAVCGGYYSARVMADAEPGAVPPTTFVLPDELESNVRALLQDDDARRNLGRAARAFVTERWAPEAVARRYLRLMAGDIPAEWTFDPTTSTYIEGWGIESGVRSEAIREYVSAMGTDALCLPRGSAAEGRLLEEIGSR
jgi:glycosyltransferase involved in cell wall biosynthesis